MLDIFWFQELSPFLIIAGIMLDAFAIIGMYYFLKTHFNSCSYYPLQFEDTREDAISDSQYTNHDSDAIFKWLVLRLRSRESSDEEPSQSRLEINRFFLIQGGQRWNVNQASLYPLQVKGL